MFLLSFCFKNVGRSAEITDLWHNWKKRSPAADNGGKERKKTRQKKPKQVVERSECLAADPWWTGGPGSTCWELPRIDKRPGSTLGPQFYTGDRGWQRNNFFLSLYNCNRPFIIPITLYNTFIIYLYTFIINLYNISLPCIFVSLYLCIFTPLYLCKSRLH